MLEAFTEGVNLISLGFIVFKLLCINMELFGNTRPVFLAKISTSTIKVIVSFPNNIQKLKVTCDELEHFKKSISEHAISILYLFYISESKNIEANFRI